MNDSASLLFDEAFGQLDDDGREQLDLASSSDPDLAARRTRLHLSLDRLLDSDDLEPPAGLADRTIARVARHAEEPKLLEFAPSRPRFRWADVGVAAAVMLIGLMSLVPAVRHQQMKVDQLACGDNLRQIGLALNQYANTFQSYPYVDPSCPAAYVGSAFVLLSDTGLLQDHSTLHCPCHRDRAARVSLPEFQDLLGREQNGPGTCRNDVQADYAYHLGVNVNGGRGQAAPLPFGIEDRVPLVADQPPYALGAPGTLPGGCGLVLTGNSPNHAGSGQNVLFSDGRVEWRRTRWISADDLDIFLNQLNDTRPGVHLRDAVLTPCVMRFRD